MKKIIELITIVLILTSFSCIEQCYECNSNSDCDKNEFCNKKEVEQDGEDISCTSRSRCEEERCHALNIDCGQGECVRVGYNTPVCDCDEGVYIYKTKNYSLQRVRAQVHICLDNLNCSNDDDCIGVFTLTPNNYFLDLNSCIEGECSP